MPLTTKGLLCMRNVFFGTPVTAGNILGRQSLVAEGNKALVKPEDGCMYEVAL